MMSMIATSPKKKDTIANAPFLDRVVNGGVDADVKFTSRMPITFLSMMRDTVSL